MARTTRTELRLRREGRTRNRRRFVAAATAGLLLMTTAVNADNADGDIVGPGPTTLEIETGTSFSRSIELYVIRQSNANVVETVAWAFTTSGACGGITATAASPLTFTLPASWEGLGSSDFGTKSINLDPPVLSSATLSGTAGPAGTSCTVTYTGTPTESFSGQGIVPGQRTVEFKLNFVAPTNSAPEVAFTGGPTEVDESSTAEHTYSWSFVDPDGDEIGAVTSSCGNNGAKVSGSDLTNGTSGGSFKCIFDDGPKISVVSVSATDGELSSNTAQWTVDIDNVAPTISAFSGSPANVFVGQDVTFTAAATDVSAADLAAGFDFSFNGESFGSTNTMVTSYATCGLQTESVRAKDKDGGVSASADASVNVHDGGWHGAIKPAMRNMVQKGRVVPVQIRVGCDGVPVTDLNPTIQLLKGEFDPATEPDSEAILVATSVSAADASGVMRWTGESYMYNLQIPKSADAGQQYTIRVRPWGADGAVLQSVVEIRK